METDSPAKHLRELLEAAEKAKKDRDRQSAQATKDQSRPNSNDRGHL